MITGSDLSVGYTVTPGYYFGMIPVYTYTGMYQYNAQMNLR